MDQIQTAGRLDVAPGLYFAYSWGSCTLSDGIPALCSSPHRGLVTLRKLDVVTYSFHQQRQGKERPGGAEFNSNKKDELT